MMSTTRAQSLHRSWALWLALLLAVFGALVPTVSRTLVWAQGNAAWVEICNTTGQRWVALGLSDVETAGLRSDSYSDENAPDPARMLDHCPFCLLSADRTAPPSQAVVPHFALPGHAVVPVRQQVLTRFSFFALAPPPRGPPAFLSR
jgi:hypothetical protein